MDQPTIYDYTHTLTHDQKLIHIIPKQKTTNGTQSWSINNHLQIILLPVHSIRVKIKMNLVQNMKTHHIAISLH